MDESNAAQSLRAEPEAIARAAQMLRAGRLVAFPTETVYGLGADATSAAAVARIFAAKDRPPFNPLIAHVASVEAALVEGVFSSDALALAQAFWPGPLTLVLPVASTGTVCDGARAGLNSVGLRVPAPAVARALLTAVARPVAAPSANRSGRVSPVSAAHVAQDLGTRVDLILDDGPCAIGIESTVVACIGGTTRLLRPGGVTREAIEAVIGRALDAASESESSMPLAPGQLVSHYAPRATLRLDARVLAAGEAGLDFGGQLARSTPAGAIILDLSARRDLDEAAAHLFDHLRRLDDSGAQVIAVAPVPGKGLGEAINDRLLRAAAPRAVPA